MKKHLALLATVLGTIVLGVTESACVVVGRSTSGGWFIWPGGFGLVILIVILYLVFGRR